MTRVAVWTLAAAVVAYASDWFSMQFTLPDNIVAFAYPQMGLLVATTTSGGYPPNDRPTPIS